MRQGVVTMGAIIAGSVGVLAIGGAIFAFGGRIAVIEATGIDTRILATGADEKGQRALNQTAELNGKMDMVLRGMVNIGAISKDEVARLQKLEIASSTTR